MGAYWQAHAAGSSWECPPGFLVFLFLCLIRESPWWADLAFVINTILLKAHDWQNWKRVFLSCSHATAMKFIRSSWSKKLQLYLKNYNFVNKWNSGQFLEKSIFYQWLLNKSSNHAEVSFAPHITVIIFHTAIFVLSNQFLVENRFLFQFFAVF